MQTAFQSSVRHSFPPPELADYDFLRATYEALLRARDPDPAAIDAAFDALDAAHQRLRVAHQQRVRLPDGVH